MLRRKPFHAPPPRTIVPISYGYLFYGHAKTHFVIADLPEERTKIRVIEDDTPIVNDVPSKFLSWPPIAERRAAAPRTEPDVAAVMPGPDGPA
jgi:hypothetical protein